MRDLALMFFTIFLAEVGDKTQLATMLFASERRFPPLVTFLASGGALVLSAAIAVFLGNLAGRHLEALPLKLIAGLGFIAIGVMSVVQHVRGV